MNEKKLGFGLMRLPLLRKDDPTSIDMEQTKQMVDDFMAAGFTYFDTAWMYHRFKSEEAIKEALVDRHPRDSYTLASKLHAAYIKTEEERDRMFEEQLRKTGAGYFDYYLIHDVRVSHYEIYERLHCFEFVAEKKRQGLIKHVGMSFHDTAEVLDQVLTEHPELEFVQLQINYLDWESESVQSRKCYEVARKHGKPIIVMEPVKGGTLAKVPGKVAEMFKAHDPAMSVPSWAIRFAAGLDGVFMVLSGMSNLDQLHDNMSYMADFKPLDEAEIALVHKAADMIRNRTSIPCTACAYCEAGCPMGIPIPTCFSLYNADLQEDDDADVPPRDAYLKRTADGGRASACIECGQCEGVCPQQLPIIEHLKTVADYFEE